MVSSDGNDTSESASLFVVMFPQQIFLSPSKALSHNSTSCQRRFFLHSVQSRRTPVVSSQSRLSCNLSGADPGLFQSCGLVVRFSLFEQGRIP